MLVLFKAPEGYHPSLTTIRAGSSYFDRLTILIKFKSKICFALVKQGCLFVFKCTVDLIRSGRLVLNDTLWIDIARSGKNFLSVKGYGLHRNFLAIDFQQFCVSHGDSSCWGLS